MSQYLVTFRPLEPYFLGGERNARFGDSTIFSQPYYIHSLNVPSQTTLFGALRYLILEASGRLISNWADAAQRQRAAEAVGPSSFSFERTTSFGALKSISPAFLINCCASACTDITQHALVPAPMNAVVGGDGGLVGLLKVVEPPAGVHLSRGGLYATDYNVKNGYCTGWLDLATCKVHESGELFAGVTRVGIDASRPENQDDAFFKKESKVLSPLLQDRGGGFACFANIDMAAVPGLETLSEQGGIVFMGQDKSTFSVEFTPCSQNVSYPVLAQGTVSLLEEALSASCEGGTPACFWYSLGDCLVEHSPRGFFIVETDYFRHLGTHYEKRSSYRQGLSKSGLYRIARGGSVFYQEPRLVEEDRKKRCAVVGMNQLLPVNVKE
ncbi:MAG: type III-B CRISPR module-associated Cmr3 family protein [Atopobiaceae bacterium]